MTSFEKYTEESREINGGRKGTKKRGGGHILYDKGKE